MRMRTKLVRGKKINSRMLRLVRRRQYQFKCPLCSKFARDQFAPVLRHIKDVHSFDPSFHIVCGLDGCPASYTNYESFRSHVYLNHKHILNLHDTEDGTVTMEGAVMEPDQSSHTDIMHKHAYV